MNTTAENKERVTEGLGNYMSNKYVKPVRQKKYDRNTSPLYSECVFSSTTLSGRELCAALTEPECLFCDKCGFFKSRDEYHRDPYSGYVEKRKTKKGV